MACLLFALILSPFGVINHWICGVWSALIIQLNFLSIPVQRNAVFSCRRRVQVTTSCTGNWAPAPPVTNSCQLRSAVCFRQRIRRQTACIIMISDCLDAHNTCCGWWLVLKGWCHIVEGKWCYKTLFFPLSAAEVHPCRLTKAPWFSQGKLSCSCLCGSSVIGQT